MLKFASHDLIWHLNINMHSSKSKFVHLWKHWFRDMPMLLGVRVGENGGMAITSVSVG